MQTIKQYDIFEVTFDGETSVTAEFSMGETKVFVESFLCGEGQQAVRFMPHLAGEWQYAVAGKVGAFSCVPQEGVHGRVQAAGHHFTYEDCTPYYPFGTTSYAWTSQEDALIDETIASLKAAPFNKIRMCIFPKNMPYNHNEPPYFPFAKDENGEWDTSKPDLRYWDRLDKCLLALREMNIEADVILFHPYDRWGFSKLGMQRNLQYLKYAVARLSAYRNVWWSLANEYEVVESIRMDDWDTIGCFIKEHDAFGHLTSIHNWMRLYPKKDWMTHLSIQSGEVRRVQEWQNAYDLPVVIDEFGYEGDIPFNWGNLSAFEFIIRAWAIASVGGYATHGETFHREDEVLWWAKGGKLYGQAPARWAFLRGVIEEIGALDPIPHGFEDPNGLAFDSIFLTIAKDFPPHEKWNVQNAFVKFHGMNEGHRLYYLSRECPCFFDLTLPEADAYKVEVIDIWEMTRTTALESASGKVRIPLPAKEGMAVLATKLEK